MHIHETRQKFLDGSLHPANILMCPHTCVTNLPQPRQKHPGKEKVFDFHGIIFYIEHTGSHRGIYM